LTIKNTGKINLNFHVVLTLSHKYLGFRFLRSLTRRCKYHPSQKPLICLTSSLALIKYSYFTAVSAPSKYLFRKASRRASALNSPEADSSAAAAVGMSAQRGERIASENGYSLMDE
jgi:hypothetical protein